MSEQQEDLPTALLHERDRVRDEIVPLYESIPTGVFALAVTIRPALALADEALKEHDVVKMVQALAALREIEA